MELKRRSFLKGLLAAAAGFVVGGWKLFERTAPVRFVKALHTTKYPGRVVKMVESEVQKPGRWNG